MNSSSSASAMNLAPNLKQRCLRPLVVLGLLLFGLSLSAFGQSATVVGTVTDPSGSVVPHATITATSVETNQVRTLTTADDGQYVIPDLQIGHYSIRAEAAGFKIAEQKGIVLNVGDRARINFAMELGGNKETVTVEATAVRVQSDSGEVSSVITGQQVTQLATNGRSMYSLANLTPGASSGQGDFQTPTPVGGDANISFNGLRESHNLYMLDGAESSDRGGGGGSDVMPSMDSIAEFRMLTSNYSAEFGLSSAATMTAVIKSGTKTFHASAWEFLRNDALDARNYFNPAPNKVAELRFNTYGFNVGGQVPLWKSHPTFFFYNMEWRSLIQGGLTNQTVPLTSAYGGDFGPSFTNATLHTPCAFQVSPAIQGQLTGAGQTLSTPAADGSCTADTASSGSNLKAFTNNTIPTSLLDPNSQALLGAGIFPAPTSGAQFIGGNNSPTNVREEIVRIDHQFSDRFSVFGHFLDEQISQTFGTSMWSGDNVPTASNTFGNPSYSAVVHATFAINPRLLNEVAFNYNGNRIAIIPQGVVARPSGFNVPELFQGNNTNRIPEIHLAGVTGADYTTSSWPWNNKADDYQIRDDISWTKGAHQIRMGGSWAIYKKVQDLFGQTQGGYTFNNTYTGNDFADFLLGYADQYNELAVQDNGYWNNVSWAAYVQDNWRVNHRLTLNLGLRWDGVP
ncbi:MAG TPA: TonB-dependent receptor, partial [Terriglobales bacterium]|nr:TonB-dependent receptor [Terriglobales bacterium]